MIEIGLRRRVERLLSGVVRPDDLNHLFLFARDKNDGRQTIREIGDFIAHRDERNKGIVTDSVREWATIVAFFGPTFSPRQPYPWNKLPSLTPDFLRVNASRVKAQWDLKSKGLNRRDIDHALPRILDIMSRNQDGTFTLGSFSSEKDESIFDFLVSAFVPRSAFNGDKLFEDFCAVLKSRSLIKREEMDILKTLRNAITLHVAAIMHNSAIVVNEHVSITLRVTLSDDDGVTVVAAAPTRDQPRKVTFWASPIYVVTGRLEDLCSDALLAAGKLDAAELEIGPDNKLTII